MAKQLETTSEGSNLKAWVPYAAVAVLVAGGLYWTYGAWTSGDRSMDATLLCFTPGCGYTTSRELQVGEILPARCPKCDKDSVVSAFKCPGCGTPNAWNEDRGLPPPTKCTKCGREVRYGQ